MLPRPIEKRDSKLNMERDERVEVVHSLRKVKRKSKCASSTLQPTLRRVPVPAGE